MRYATLSAGRGHRTVSQIVASRRSELHGTEDANLDDEPSNQDGFRVAG